MDVVKQFKFDLPEGFAPTLDLEPGEISYLYREDVVAIVPAGMLEALKATAEAETGHSLVFTDLVEGVWLFASQGPVRGVMPHTEGLVNENHTMLLALTSVPDGGGGDTHVEHVEEVFPHRAGRALIFPSLRIHSSDEVTVPVLRLGLAALVHEA